MSQVTSPALSVRNPLRAHWVAALSALLALLATAAVVLVLAIDGGSSGIGNSVGERQQPALRADGGPEETAVAAAVGSQPAPSARPDESVVAASIGRAAPASRTAPPGQDFSGRPDESTVAAAVSGR
jgi:hypothetical protein